MARRQIFVVLFLSGMVLSSLLGSVRGSVVLSWGVERIRAYCVWDNDNWNMTSPWDVDIGANAGQYTTIAVIDTGVDYYKDGQGNIHYHPDLAGNIAGGEGFAYYSGFVHYLADYQDTDPYGHGTGIIGIILAIVNGLGANQSGIIGAAPKTRIYALKYFSGDPKEMATAINYSVDVLGANIISMSWGWSTPINNTDLFTACNYAYGRGALLFAAVGNDYGPINGYPELYNSVSAVGAICQNDSRAAFSDYGPKLDFVAPGVGINTTSVNWGYRVQDGTSFAVAYADATAALIWSSKVDTNFDFNHDGLWENDEVWAKMQNTTYDLLPVGKDNDTGWGLINAWLANQRPVGDINGDNKTDGKDIALANIAFGTAPGDPKWDPRADVNIDKKADGKDIAIIALHFGQVDP